MGDIPAQFLIKELVLHPTRHWKSWVVILILAIITHGSAWVAALKKGGESAKIESIQQMKQICGAETISEDIDKPQIQSQENPDCFKEIFAENEKKWETGLYKKERDGFWCSRREDYIDPVMWYPDGFRPDFKRVTVEYEVRNDIWLKKDNPPSFVFTYGKEQPIFKLWVPEGDGLQLFGFAKNLDFNSEELELTREPAEELSDPAEINRIDTLKIESSHARGNDLFLNFTYSYISPKTDSGEEDTIPKEIKLPISDILSSTKAFPFGVGTYIGNCIRIISYEICQ